jgi:REP element-mobilizing transposase RayT
LARPLRIEYPGVLYHVTSRGNEKKDIFRSKKDREKFLSYLSSAWERHGAVFHAYCLMSNHFHLDPFQDHEAHQRILHYLFQRQT